MKALQQFGDQVDLVASRLSSKARPSRPVSSQVRRLIRNWSPPAWLTLVQRALDHVRPAPWEFLASGWPADVQTRGWNVAGIAKLQKEHWPAYAEMLKGTGPIVVNHEGLSKNISNDLATHNTLISFAYVLALSARYADRVSILDWGGGIGHYYLLSKAVLPGAEIDYHCKDVSLLCRAGEEVLPQVHFLETSEECFARRYDLVLASSSLWYEADWRSVLDKLIAAADPYLYVSRMIFVETADSYVAIQRPWAMGYRTEYMCWILNEEDFIEHVVNQDMVLIREFLLGEAPHIHRAREQGKLKGFLFCKRAQQSP